MMAFIASIMILLTTNFSKADENQAPGQSTGGANQPETGAAYVVTPANGPGWLRCLGVFDLRFTAMGQMGGYDLAPPSPREEPGFPIEGSPPGGSRGMGRGGMMGGGYSNRRFSPYELQKIMSEKFLLAGADPTA
jgi:hypothetical protein